MRSDQKNLPHIRLRALFSPPPSLSRWSGDWQLAADPTKPALPMKTPTHYRTDSRTARATARRGVATVEFAVVAPVFFVLVLGVIEFTRAMMVAEVLTNAAHEGTRAGILDDAQTSDVTRAVNNYLSAAGISGASTTVSPSPPSSAAYNQTVTVNVSIPYSSVSWLPIPQFLGGTTLKAGSVMRRETSQ
jgi:Flp pilus assembly protein TadG